MKGNHKEEMVNEKHIPVVTVNEDGKNIVQVGTVLHPMNDDHYIMFIETISEDKNHLQLQYLHPGEEAKMILASSNA